FDAGERDHVHIVRCHRSRPDDPVLVVALLDDRGEHAPRADPIAPHDERLLGPVLVEERRSERRRVLRLELEDVADLDRRLEEKPPPANGAGVALPRGAKVGETGLEVAPGLDATEGEAGAVPGPDRLAPPRAS